MVNTLVETGVLGLDGDSLVRTRLGEWAAVELLREHGLDAPVVD